MNISIHQKPAKPSQDFYSPYVRMIRTVLYPIVHHYARYYRISEHPAKANLKITPLILKALKTAKDMYSKRKYRKQGNR